MARLTDETLAKLAEFLVSELGGKVIDGITYSLVQKDERGKLLFERCRRIRKELSDSGYAENEVFTVYEVHNGYIFDMEEGIVKKIARDLVREYKKDGNADYLKEAIKERRENDSRRLGKFLLNEMGEGKESVNVALFSRNSVPRILVTAKDTKGNPVGIKFQSFALRHIDLERVNIEHLIPKGMRIAAVEPVEILPRNTGCRFVLRLEKV